MTSFADKLLAASEDERLTPDELRVLLRRAALRLTKGEGKRPAREIVARKLCWLDGNPPDIKFEGGKMWESYLPHADGVLAALDEDTETKGSA